MPSYPIRIHGLNLWSPGGIHLIHISQVARWVLLRETLDPADGHAPV